MDRKVNRRVVLQGLGLALASTAGLRLLAHAVSAPSLYVFVPSLTRARALDALLSDGLPGVEVRVFARFVDFMSAIASRPPDGALTLTAGLRAMALQPALQGEKHGDPREPYVLLTKDPALTLETLGDSEIGVVDVVGRRRLPNLVREMLGLSAPPRIRRVLKLGDLLPLLALGLSAGILIPARFETEVLRMSRLPLRVLRPSTAQLERTALAFPKGRPHRVLRDKLVGAPPAVFDALGIDTWREV